MSISFSDSADSLPSPPPKWRGYVVILGGFMIHLSLSLHYTSGNMIPYLSSYLHKNVSPGTNAQDLVWVLGSVGMTHGALMIVGGLLEQKITGKWVTVIGCVLATGGFTLTSVSINVAIVMVIITQGVALGAGIAFAYVPPMAMAMQWFPERKGLISGIITGGLGFGSFFFTQVQTFYLNPHNLPASNTTGYFEEDELLDKLPSVFWLLGGMMACLQIVGWLLITPPPKNFKSVLTSKSVENGSELKEIPLKEIAASTNGNYHHGSNGEIEGAKSLLKNGSSYNPTTTVIYKDYVTPKESIRTREFYVLWGTMFCNLTFVIFISSVYKAFGQTFIEDDQFLAFVGSVACILNALARMAWGFLADKYSYRVLMCSLSLIMTTLLFTWTLTPNWPKYVYAIWVWLLFMTQGGHFTLVPACLVQTYGAKYVATIYGLISTSLIINGPFVSLLTQLLFPHIGWNGLIFVVGGLAAMTFVITLFYRGSCIKKPA